MESRIHIDSWERKETFEAFTQCDFPYAIVGQELDLGSSPEFWKKHQLSPYLSMVYAVTKTCNDISAFKQRIRLEGKDKFYAVEHDCVHADFTVPKDEKCFTIKKTPYLKTFKDFYQQAKSAKKATFDFIEEDNHLDDKWIYLSCLPWSNFNHIVQPIKTLNLDSIPRIVWGKINDQNGRWMSPFSVQAHHGFIDGYHFKLFFEELTEIFSHPEDTFAPL